MSYEDIVTADQRLIILDALLNDPDYSHNEYVLSSILSDFCHKVSRAKLATELAWLAEQNLVILSEVSGVTKVRLTPRGKDAASGACVVPGVKRPEPGL